MTPEPSRRLTLDDLNERDFKESAVWAFAPVDDEDDEPPVRPERAREVSFATGGPYLVAIDAALADGTTRPGFIRVGGAPGRTEVGPLTLFLGGRQLLIEASIPGWAGTKAVSAVERPLLPIRWTARVTAQGEPGPRTGTVSGSRLVQFLRSTLRGLRS